MIQGGEKPAQRGLTEFEQDFVGLVMWPKRAGLSSANRAEGFRPRQMDARPWEGIRWEIIRIGMNGGILLFGLRYASAGQG